MINFGTLKMMAFMKYALRVLPKIPQVPYNLFSQSTQAPNTFRTNTYVVKKSLFTGPPQSLIALRFFPTIPVYVLPALIASKKHRGSSYGCNLEFLFSWF